MKRGVSGCSHGGGMEEGVAVLVGGGDDWVGEGPLKYEKQRRSYHYYHSLSCRVNHSVCVQVKCRTCIGRVGTMTACGPYINAYSPPLR